MSSSGHKSASKVSSPSVILPELFSKYPEIVCGISTRQGGVSAEPFGMNMSYNVGDEEASVRTNRDRFFQTLHVRSAYLAIPKQVHGDNVQYATDAGSYESCDGLISDKANVFLAVSIADCLPILMFDPVTRSIAAVHSGWKGSRLMILKKAVMSMNEMFDTKPQNLLAFIGPSAGACCYEVGEEVSSQFDACYVERTPPRNPRLDLKSFNKALLMEVGVQANNIEVSPLCTICNPDLMHSYRRDRDRSGRMMAVIGVKP